MNLKKSSRVSPLMTGILSLLIPGLGQFFHKHRYRGVPSF